MAAQPGPNITWLKHSQKIYKPSVSSVVRLQNHSGHQIKIHILLYRRTAKYEGTWVKRILGSPLQTPIYCREGVRVRECGVRMGVRVGMGVRVRVRV